MRKLLRRLRHFHIIWAAIIVPQWKRYRLLRPYLSRKSGFFVEAGANDGIVQSNTLLLEKWHGWRGLLVEPIPELAETCRRNRPHSHIENCALVPFDYAQSTIAMTFCGLMSVVRGALKSEVADRRHVEEGAQTQSLVPYDLEVPARTLTALLDAKGVTQIDFLSLDVEGYELSVLQGLDFDRYKPEYMLIEARFREEIDAFLGSRYRPVATMGACDVLYARTADGL